MIDLQAVMDGSQIFSLNKADNSRLITTHDIAALFKVTWHGNFKVVESNWLRLILDLQPIFRDTPDNVAHQRRLVPTITLIKYSFVPYHQHGRIASQE